MRVFHCEWNLLIVYHCFADITIVRRLLDDSADVLSTLTYTTLAGKFEPLNPVTRLDKFIPVMPA